MPVILSGRSGSALAGAVGTSAIVDGAVTAVKLNAVSNGVYNVKAYGATGDGVTDDTAAIQSAIDAMEAAGGGVVKFPGPATYSVTGLTVADTSGVSVVGDPGAIIDSAGTAAVLRLDTCTDVLVEGLHIVGPGVVRDNANLGIRIDACTRFTVRDCVVDSTESAGIIVREGSTDGLITGCHVHDTLADGIHVNTTSKRISIVGNNLVNTGDDSIAVVSVVANGDYCTDVSIVGNTVYQSNSRGIAVVGGKRITISGNTINQTTNSGIFVYYSVAFLSYGSEDVSIVGNTVNDACTFGTPGSNVGCIDVRSGDVTYPISNVAIIGNVVRGGANNYHSIHVGETATATFNVTVADNIITGQGAGANANNGIHFSRCDGVTARGNYVAATGASGIVADSTASGHVSITGNIIEGCNLAATAGGDGINVVGASITGGIVSHNIILDAGTLLSRAIEAGTATNTAVFGNVNANDRPVLLPTTPEPMLAQQLQMGLAGPIIYTGTGSPESVVTANRGSLFLRQDGGAGTGFYVKESGTDTNTGWVAK